MNDLKEIKRLLVMLSAYYGKELNDMQIQMYSEDLACLSLEQLNMAINSYRRNPKNKTFPFPANLIELVNPEETTTDQAQELAGRIIDNIAKYGAPNSILAKQAIGELGWFVVERMGGWDALCQTDIDNLGTLRAQLRDMCSMANGKMRRDPEFLKLDSNVEKLLE